MEAKEKSAEKSAEKSLKKLSSHEDLPHAPLDFGKGPWIDSPNQAYGEGKKHQALLAGVSSMVHRLTDVEEAEVTLVVLAEDETTNY